MVLPVWLYSKAQIPVDLLDIMSEMSKFSHTKEAIYDDLTDNHHKVFEILPHRSFPSTTSYFEFKWSLFDYNSYQSWNFCSSIHQNNLFLPFQE